MPESRKELTEELLRVIESAPASVEAAEVIETIQELLRERVREKGFPPDHVADLTSRLERLHSEYTFQVGDLVQWKSGLKNRRRPFENEPAIVVELIEEPLVNEEVGPGSQYYRERLDVVLGLLDLGDDEFLLYHFDSRRFQPYEAPPTTEESAEGGAE